MPRGFISGVHGQPLQYKPGSKCISLDNNLVMEDIDWSGSPHASCTNPPGECINIKETLSSSILDNS